MATNTAVVHRSIAKQFLSKLESLLPSQTPANGLFTSASAARSASLVKDAKSKGAQLSEDYKDPSGEGKNVVRPVIVKSMTREMRVWGEEAFSPVLGVVEYDGIEEAIAIANSTEYGLAAGVWSTSPPPSPLLLLHC